MVSRVAPVTQFLIVIVVLFWLASASAESSSKVTSTVNAPVCPVTASHLNGPVVDASTHAVRPSFDLTSTDIVCIGSMYSMLVIVAVIVGVTFTGVTTGVPHIKVGVPLALSTSTQVSSTFELSMSSIPSSPVQVLKVTT